ncbi:MULTISPECIES: phosphohistidine phosphatase SixA [Alkalimonas]|uniref:Phosphohistidine phosphatase SixA n=1 Tax=Alkalimonas mucilaginosa TaxID=3057676 RepID=A0ABU7JB72_9GAMM|nr:phosphohistidine phosphatase SixA [Alkalimonas sp. MEB004]MEE2022948.1 phosphohistidine phosphatase SixA [Alkalimonas sp. MEB004]
MVNLVIMRHGEAEALQSTDAERQLTVKGITEANQMAGWLQLHFPAFDRIICSPYTRACQTAQLVLQKQAAKGCELELLSDLVPDGDPQQVQLYLDALWAAQPELRILLVSHMPLVSFLVQTFSYSGQAPIFATAGVACLHYEPEKTGQLLETASPFELNLLPV